MGQLVLAAEAHRVAPIPVGLINGTAYRGGTQPPLAPFANLAALRRRLLQEPDVPDREVISIVGPAVLGDRLHGPRGYRRAPAPLPDRDRDKSRADDDLHRERRQRGCRARLGGIIAGSQHRDRYHDGQGHQPPEDVRRALSHATL